MDHATIKVRGWVRVGGMHPDLAAAAAMTGGVFTRAQALAAGYTPAEVRAMLAGGCWLRLRRGVYCECDPADHERARYAAALAVSPPTAALSHGSAAVLLDLPLVRGRPRAVQVTVPGASAGLRHGRQVHGRGLAVGEVEVVDGLRVTSPVRTAVDLARRLDLAAAVAVCDAVLHRRPDRAAGLSDAAYHATGPGSARGRRAVELADGAAESPGESLSRVAVIAAGLPRPELQTWLGDRGGPIGRVDFFWREERTVGEFDGRVKYSGLQDLWAEKSREDRLRDAGFEVVRWTWADASGDFGRAAARIRRAFERGRARR